MSILSWNCWGLGNYQTVHAFKRVLQDEAPKVVFLMETKLPQEKMNFLKHELGYTQGLAVSSIGQIGCWLFYGNQNQRWRLGDFHGGTLMLT